MEIQASEWARAKPGFSPDGQWLAFAQPAGQIGADLWALPVTGGGDATAVRLTALPFAACLLGWHDWGPDNTIVLSLGRRPNELVMLERANAWIARAVGRS